WIPRGVNGEQVRRNDGDHASSTLPPTAKHAYRAHGRDHRRDAPLRRTATWPAGAGSDTASHGATSIYLQLHSIWVPGEGWRLPQNASDPLVVNVSTSTNGPCSALQLPSGLRVASPRPVSVPANAPDA